MEKTDAGSKGFISLYRSILDWEWYGDVNTARLFIHLLLTVNWEDKRFRGREVRRGQRVCSRGTLAKETALSIQSVRTAINRLKSTGELTDEKIPGGRIITVVKYEKYQQPTGEPTSDQPASNQRPTSDQPQLNKLIINNKQEDKEKEKEKYKKEKERENGFDAFWAAYPKKRSKGSAEKAWAKLNPDSELRAIILDRVAAARNSWEWLKEKGRYIPYPATWLNARGWEDEPDERQEYEEDSL